MEPKSAPDLLPADELPAKPKAIVIPLPKRPREQQRQPKRPKGELRLEDILNTPTPAKGRVRVPCPVERGFYAQITANDARSYYVETRVRGRDKQPKRRLGGVRPEDDQYITMPAARSMARAFKAQAHGIDKNGKGIDFSRAAVERNRGLTLAEAYAQYKADRTSPKRKKPWSEVTVGKYDRVINVYLADWSDRPLFSFNKEHIAERFKALRDGSTGESEAQLTFAVFGGIWKFQSAKLEEPTLSPTLVLNRNQQDLKSEMPERETIIAAKDFPAWWRSLDTIPNPTWAVYFRTMVLLGTRLTETLKMEWDWYDKKAHVIHLPAPVTKGKRAVGLPVGPYLAKMLEAHRRNQPLKGVRFIFADNSGQRLLDPDSVVRKLREKQKLYWTMHDLRRVYASVVSNLRIPLKPHKKLMNHSTKKDVTLGYIQVEEKELRAYQLEIERAILGRAKVR